MDPAYRKRRKAQLAAAEQDKKSRLAEASKKTKADKSKETKPE